MADNRITRHRVRNHWTYSWWKYLLMVVCAVFGVNLLFTMTAYRAPEDKKIELYLCSGWADAELAEADIWPMIQEALPDQEELVVMNIDLVGQEYYAIMQFTTYIAAQQGDILLLPKSQMSKYAADGAWDMYADLTPYIEDGTLDPRGINLTNAMYPDSEGQKRAFGIPADTLYGLADYGIDPADCVLSVTAFSGNELNCAKLLDVLIERYQIEKPDYYDEWHESRESSKASSVLYP